MAEVDDISKGCVFKSQGKHGWPGGPSWCAHCDEPIEGHENVPDEVITQVNQWEVENEQRRKRKRVSNA